MSVSIQIPTPLRHYTDDKDQVEVEGATVGDALRNLVGKHQALEPHLYTDDGALRSFVNVFLNDEDVRYMKRQDTPINDGDTLSIIPSIAGGAAQGARI